MARIGFVGLGHMGLPMALQLLKAGHQVTGFDVQSEPLQVLKQAGGAIVEEIAALAAHQEVLMTMLQTGQQVEAVCLGEVGLFAQASQGTLFIDCSSIDVKTSQAVTSAAYDKGLIAIDAPVSGGVAGAQAGTLTFMAGGEETAFEKAKPILLSMGKQAIHAGDAGMGQAAKICNNMILGISMIAISEAFTLAEHLGLSSNKLFDIVSVASGQCWAMSHYVPVKGVLPDVPAEHDYQPGFTVAMMLKDLQLSQHAAEDTKIKTPLGEHAAKLYEAWAQAGYSALDFSSIIRMLK